jgi:hypothetical protein
MRPLYKQLLTNTFRAELDPSKKINHLVIQNNSEVPVQPKLWTQVFLMGHSSFPVIPPWGKLDTKSLSTPWKGTYAGDVIIFCAATTGGFMSADTLHQPAGSEISLEQCVLPRQAAALEEIFKAPNVGSDWRDLVSPNDLGEPPSPDEDVLVPIDSPRVVVGIGGRRAEMGGTWSFLLHEQSWRRSASSIVLAPDETRTLTTTHTSGRTETSSSESQITEAIGATLSAGWGPVSASISASLSRSDTTSRSISLAESDSVSMQITYKNTDPTRPELLLFWNIIDIYTWVAMTRMEGVSLAVVEVVQPPALVRSYRSTLPPILKSA